MPRQQPPPPLIVPPSTSSQQPTPSPRSARGHVHPTSSLRDPLPDATPPQSRSASPTSDLARDDFLTHQTKGAGRRRTRHVEGHHEDTHGHNDRLSPNPRSDKKRRVNSRSSRQVPTDGAFPSPSSHQSYPDSHSPSSPHEQLSGRRMHSTLAPIKPIGFAQSREYRRDGDDQPIPSPVVMGFDFKGIDDSQLRTVRDTISIKEQQQALIAQRRKDVAASTPATPKELTFKGWQPKDPSTGVGKRREKTRERVEAMTINTGVPDHDGHPASKSAPLHQGLASQQQSPRHPPGTASGSTHHPTILPPIPGYSHMDPRTAPLSHTRTRHSDERERDYRDHESRNQYWRSLPRGSGFDNMPHTARPAITIPSDRRNFSGSTLPPSHSGRDRQVSGGHANRNGRYSQSPSPPRSVVRESLHQPQQNMYDLMQQADSLSRNLQDLLHRYEGAYATQLNAVTGFKATASQANDLLHSLQASANSLKDMVRYEINKAGSEEKREVDELRKRLKSLEEKMESQMKQD